MDDVRARAQGIEQPDAEFRRAGGGLHALDDDRAAEIDDDSEI